MSESAHLRSVSINLPADVADRLDREANPGEFVADVVRARIRWDEYNTILHERGMTVTPEGLARATTRRLASGQPSVQHPQIRDRVRREIEAQRQADERAGRAPAA